MSQAPAERDPRIDSEILDALEVYIKKHGFVLLHNLTGRDDPDWPNNWNHGGIGLIPHSPRTLRHALSETVCIKRGNDPAGGGK